MGNLTFHSNLPGLKTFLRSLFLFVLLRREFLLSRGSCLSLSLKNSQPFSVLEIVASPPFPLISLELKSTDFKTGFSSHVSFFFFFSAFVCGCTGSSLLCMAFSSCSERGLLPS